jgi:glutathione S-transferase
MRRTRWTPSVARARSPNTSLAHPWGEVPVLDHDGFSISETAAIARCVRVDAGR